MLVFLIDTLRADHLGCYGYGRNTTPNLDAFAREGLLFERAYAVAPMTAPSHATLFTATWPATHLVWNDLPLGGGAMAHPRLSPSAVTLAEAFEAAGYQTAAICDGGWLIPERGFDQGFQTFDTGNLGVVDRVARGLEWLEQRDPRKPFFLFLHTYQVHTPFLPPEGYEERFAGGYDGKLRGVLADAREYAQSPEIENPLVDIQRKIFNPVLDDLEAADVGFLRALYDAELSLVDEQFALLMARLRVDGLLDDTIVVVTSDHGEEFGEHGEFGHKQVYDECLHVPWMMRYPGGPRGMRISEPVSQVDFAPTLLELAGLPALPSAVGEPLRWENGSLVDARTELVAESNHPKQQSSYRTGGWKSVLHLRDELLLRSEVFDLGSDPQEANPLGGADDFARRSAVFLEGFREAAAAHRETHLLHPVLMSLEELDADKQDELAALGYVGG